MAGDVPSSVATGKYVRQIIVSAPGPQGPGGVSGLQSSEIAALVSYRHTQNTPATTWTIVHNLNFYPNVTVFNTANDQVEGSIVHTNETTLVITFSSTTAGKAHLS
jgi:hypothetical protein